MEILFLVCHSNIYNGHPIENNLEAPLSGLYHKYLYLCHGPGLLDLVFLSCGLFSSLFLFIVC